MRPVTILAASAALLGLLSGCGASVDLVPHGRGGDGGAGGGGGTGGAAGAVPDECQVETSLTPPYAVTFRFHGPPGGELFLRESCVLQYEVASCAEEYAEPWPLVPGLSADCSDPDGGCVASEACLELGIVVAAGDVLESTWSGHHYTFGTNAQGCVCHDEHVAPAGRYRLTLPVYGSDQAAQNDEPLHHTVSDFTLPAPSGIVDIPLVNY